MNESKYIEINDQNLELEEGSYFSERSNKNAIVEDVRAFREELSRQLYRDTVGPPATDFQEVEYLK